MKLNRRLTALLLLSFSYFLYTFIDETLTFVLPLAVTEVVHAAVIAGVIVSLSSIIGLVFDFILPRLLGHKTWRFQLVSAGVIALFFPTFVALGIAWSSVACLLLAGFAWGIYFELFMFAKQNFIVTQEDVHNYSRDWGIVYALHSLSALIAPLLGSLLLLAGSLSLGISLFLIQALGLFLAVAAICIHPFRHSESTKISQTARRSMHQELQIWSTLVKRFFPAVLIGLLASCVDAAFWTVGGLLGLSLLSKTYDWLPVFIFTLPAILGSVLVTRLGIYKRKKFYSTVCLCLTGVCLLPIYFFQTVFLLALLLIFIASLFFSICGPLVDSVFSDLQSRSGEYGQELLSLERMNYSAGYIIMPILMGVFAQSFGYAGAFSIFGAIIVAVTLLLFVITPRKLQTPHIELDQII